MTDEWGSEVATRAQLSSRPEGLTAISFVHEQIHFLELIASIVGLRILLGYVEFGVAVTVALAVPPNAGEDVIQGLYDIPALLRTLHERAVVGTDFEDRARHLVAQGQVCFGLKDYPYTGTRPAWSLVRQEVLVGGTATPMEGFVTPRKRFKPFTPGVLAEGMARRVDRWFAHNARINHEWDGDGNERARIVGTASKEAILSELESLSPNP
jgi:hypothetical protein